VQILPGTRFQFGQLSVKFIKTDAKLRTQLSKISIDKENIYFEKYKHYAKLSKSVILQIQCEHNLQWKNMSGLAKDRIWKKRYKLHKYNEHTKKKFKSQKAVVKASIKKHKAVNEIHLQPFPPNSDTNKKPQN